MQQTSLKSIARHLAAVNAGKVEKTNIIGIRKAINTIEREREPAPGMVDAVFQLECAIQLRQPIVAGELHESGLKVLRNPRYAKRWDGYEQDIIDNLTIFQLVRFDRIGRRGQQAVPVYRAVAYAGVGKVARSFTFRNIPWQSARALGEEDGPRIVSESGY